MSRPDWMPLDPDATPDEQRLLDEANGLLLTLRTLDAGDALVGPLPAGEAVRKRVNARLDAIRAELLREGER